MSRYESILCRRSKKILLFRLNRNNVTYKIEAHFYKKF